MLAGINVNGQVLNLSKWLTNNSAKFTIRTVQPDWEKDQFYAETVVEVTSLKSADWKEINLLSRNAWLSSLNGQRFDWIANLVLYELHRKYADMFSVFETRDNWIKSRKKEDMAYWKKNLK